MFQEFFRIYFSIMDSPYAQAYVDETNPPKRSLCMACKVGDCELVRPLILEWAEGSDLVGDFTWPSLGREVMIVTDRVRKKCEELHLQHLRFDPITFHQNLRLKRPTRVTSRTKRRVWLPYEGPPLWDMQPLHWGHLDALKSGMSLNRQCEQCGFRFWKFNDINKLIIPRKELDGSGIFKIHERPASVYCDSTIKSAFESAGFTNIIFEPRGVISS